MPYEYLRHRRIFDPHDGLWSITHIVRRGKKLPTIRNLVSSHRPHRHR